MMDSDSVTTGAPLGLVTESDPIPMMCLGA
jgi:hypothetical protein